MNPFAYVDGKDRKEPTLPELSLSISGLEVPKPAKTCA